MISKTGVRRAKIDKHTIGGVDRKKELIFIFFGMCLPAILLFASISVASATNYMPQDCYSFTTESAPDAPVSDPKGPYTGTEGVPLTFNESGSYCPDGSIVAYEWDFGDGNNATGATPTHTYAQNGTYTVTLTVTDNEGATNTSTTTAAIADTEPTAEFSASPTSGQEPLTVTFTNNSASHDGIVTWDWDFDNDGETDSTEQNPTHEYTEDGVYTVSLTVTESDGDSDTMTKADYISVTEVNNEPYTPDNPSPSDGAMDVSIANALTWTGGDPDDEDTVTYDIYFGTDTNPPLVAEDQPEATYDPGTLDYDTEYYWRIVATDSNGASNDGDIWSFSTTASPGTDLIGLWHFDKGSGEIAADSSGNDNDGTIYGASWIDGKLGNAVEFDGTADYIDCGNDASLNNVRGAVTILMWIKPASRLPPSDNCGIVSKNGWNGYVVLQKNYGSIRWITKTSSGVKQINSATPTAGVWHHVAATYDGAVMKLYLDGEKANEIAQCGTIVDTAEEHLFIARRDGDRWKGAIDEVKIYNGALSAEEIRADYEAYPSKCPSTAIIDSTTPDPSEQEKVTINPEPENHPPVADTKGPYTGTKGVPIAFDGSTSSDPDGRIDAYVWDFGDENRVTGVTPEHTYAEDGTYNVTLTVTDDSGATDTDTTTATIADTEPTADFSASPTSGQGPLTVTFNDNSVSYDGIEAWDWDFDSDGETDSTVQNPTYMYAEDGAYTVSLTVYENDADSDTMTNADYISVTKVNNPPFKPDNPSPSDGAADVSADADLSWTGGDPDAGDTVTYNVYFGTSTTLPLVSENQPETTYDPGTLDHSTEYYWQIVAKDDHGATMEGEVLTFTTAAAPDTPPIVSNPSATPDTILNDNGRPRIPGTHISQLSVTVTDDTGVDTVTIDLSPIGGSDETQMTNIPETDTWTFTTNAVEGINIAHNLIVTATGTNGNSNTAVSIQLTVLRRGDVDHDNDVDEDDASAIQEYLKGNASDPGVFSGDVYPATGDYVVDEMDAVYIFEYTIGNASEP